MDGISKSLACTGLRIGFTFGKKEVIKGMGKIQGQSTSGANALIQKALARYDFSQIAKYLDPIKEHLRLNSEVLKEELMAHGLGKTWYQTNGAFYFFLGL